MKHDLKHLLQSASLEIKSLQRRNEILAAQVRVINIFGAALDACPSGGCASPCIAYELDREVTKMEEQEKDEIEDGMDAKSPV